MFPYHRLKSCPSKISPPSDAFPNTAKAYAELLLLNENPGDGIPTYDHFRRCWNFVPIPQRTTSAGAVDVAPTGLRSMFNSLGAPSSEVYCAHTDKKGNRFLAATVRVDGDYNGRKATFFQCYKDHLCHFKMLVRPKNSARKSQILTTWDQISRFQEILDEASIQDDEEASAQPTSQASSQSHPLLQDDPRRPFHPMPSPGQSPPSPRRLTSSPRPVVPFFDLPVALARANSDHSLISHLQEEQWMGRYRRSPFDHPLANETAADLPYVMHAYDKSRHPDCATRTFANLTFFATDLGHCIRQFLSTVGIPLSAFSNMIRHCNGCSNCRCMFSFDGYNAHLDRGHCRNLVQPPLNELPILAEFHPPLSAVSDFTYRTYYKNQRPTHCEEVLDSPTGLALLEWNSRIGIPSDVWMMVCTGYIVCPGCDLARSFAGHKLHLDDQGMCADVGQAKVIAPSLTDSDDEQFTRRF
ncbi:hypothetical protein C8J57DRAFT_1225897 [Mycena rebaudengoi]|nr:hypothetical protein C8J57DRAFT_1225897 [Mycena rebaudengoi]